MLPHLDIVRFQRAGDQLQRDDGGFRFRRRLSGFFNTLVQLDVGHGDPGVILHAAPFVIVSRHDLIDIDPVADIFLTDHIIGQSGAGTDIHIIRGNGAADVFRLRRLGGVSGIGGNFRLFRFLRQGGHVHDLAGIGIPPLGIDGNAVGKRAIQHLHLIAAHLGSIPSGKLIHETVSGFVLPGGDICKVGHRRFRIAHIVAVDLIAAGTAVSVHEYVFIIVGHTIGTVIGLIDAMYVHIGFAQPTGNEGELAAGGTPQAHTEEQIRTHITADDRGAEIAADGIHPVGTAVIGKGNQCVELGLGQIQRILFREFIHLALKVAQFVIQQDQRFFFRNVTAGDRIVVIEHIVGATGTVAHSILLIVPLGTAVEALHGLQHRNEILRGSIGIVGGAGAYRRGGQHAQQQRQRCQYTDPSSLHRLCSSRNIDSRIIPEQRPHYKWHHEKYCATPSNTRHNVRKINNLLGNSVLLWNNFPRVFL